MEGSSVGPPAGAEGDFSQPLSPGPVAKCALNGPYRAALGTTLPAAPP